MGRHAWIWFAVPVLTAGLCFVSYQSGGEAARTAAMTELEKLRGEKGVLQQRHDAAVEGLAQAEGQLRLSQQAYAELSTALDVSREQMKQMRQELAAIRQALESDIRGGGKTRKSSEH